MLYKGNNSHVISALSHLPMSSSDKIHNSTSSWQILGDRPLSPPLTSSTSTLFPFSMLFTCRAPFQFPKHSIHLFQSYGLCRNSPLCLKNLSPSLSLPGWILLPLLIGPKVPSRQDQCCSLSTSLNTLFYFFLSHYLKVSYLPASQACPTESVISSKEALFHYYIPVPRTVPDMTYLSNDRIHLSSEDSFHIYYLL